MALIEECQRLFEVAAPGNPTWIWDRILECDYARLDLARTRTVKFAYLRAAIRLPSEGRLVAGP